MNQLKEHAVEPATLRWESRPAGVTVRLLLAEDGGRFGMVQLVSEGCWQWVVTRADGWSEESTAATELQAIVAVDRAISAEFPGVQILHSLS
jgi:hypothetical protein